MRTVRGVTGSLLACVAGCSVLIQEASAQTSAAVLEPAALQRHTTTLIVGGYPAFEVEAANGTEELPYARVSSARADVHTYMTYAARARQSAFSVSAGTILRFSDAVIPLLMNQQAGLGLELRRSRTQLRASYHVDYLPYYSLGAFGGVGEASVLATAPLSQGSTSRLDYALFRRPAYEHNVAAQIARTLTRRSALSVNYRLHKINFVGDSAATQAHAISGRLTRGVGKHVALRAGYEYQSAVLDRAQRRGRVQGHNVDLGVDYSRPLPFSRHTTIAFSSGSSVVTIDRGQAHLRALGQATVNHQIKRTWTARVSYDRHLQFIDGFSDPFFSDGVTVGGTGAIGRRLKVAASSGLSVGQVGLDRGGSTYRTTNSSVQLRASVTPQVALDAQYFYYHYTFGAGVPLSSGFARGLDRTGFRAGVTFFTAAIR